MPSSGASHLRVRHSSSLEPLLHKSSHRDRDDRKQERRSETEHRPGATLRRLFTHPRRGGLLFANLPEVDEPHPMHYRHEPRVLLAGARRLGFRVLRSRAGSPWVLQKPEG